MDITDMADMDIMVMATARGRLRQLLWLLLSQLLLPSLATDTMADMATVATEAMVATEGMVMDTAMDMVMATTARDLLMPTTDTEDTEDTEDMVMATVMAMATDTRDKKEGVVMVKIEFGGYTMKWICKKSSHDILLLAKEIYERTCT